MGASGSELLGRKRQCSLGGRRGEGGSWVHFSAPNAFSELSIFRHCVSRQGVHVVERYQDWRLNNVLPAGNEQYRVNHTSLHCKTCGRALDRYLRAINAANDDNGPGCPRVRARQRLARARWAGPVAARAWMQLPSRSKRKTCCS